MSNQKTMAVLGELFQSRIPLPNRPLLAVSSLRVFRFMPDFFRKRGILIDLVKTPFRQTKIVRTGPAANSRRQR